MKMDEFIRAIPKAELNIHIEGTLEPDLLYELAKRNNLKIPFDSLEDVYKAYDFADLDAFLDIYYTGIKVLVTEQDFYALTYAYFQKAAAQNIRHAEIFFDPQAHLERGISFDTVINGIHVAMQDAKRNLGISSDLIMCFMRNLTERDAEAVFEAASAFKDWIVAVGLDSTELGNPPQKFEKVFAKAREQGFLTTAIAGEVGPPDYIWQAIDILKVSRIDHGVQCVHDVALMTRLAAMQIPINVAPISNVELNVVPSLQDHPLKKMYEAGLNVTVSSDDPAYFGAYLNDTFIQTTTALKLSKVMIYEMVRNAFNGSFLDSNTKQKYIAELDRFYKLANVT